MKNPNMQINILGTDYEIINESPDDVNSDGSINYMTKKIHVFYRGDNPDNAVRTWFLNKVKRHEIIHGFAFESGLEELAFDEQYTEWLAIQFPKLLEVFKQADAL